MSASAHDLETLAAFLDGRLDAAEREAFVERLGEDEDLYEVMLETRALQSALDEEAGGGTVIDGGRVHSLWRRRFTYGALLAASLVAVVLGPRLLTASPPTLAELSEGLATQVADDGQFRKELLQTPWSVPRGFSLDDFSSFRLGVRDAMLRLALETGELDEASDQAGLAAVLLEVESGLHSRAYAELAAELSDAARAGSPPPTTQLVARHETVIGQTEVLTTWQGDLGRFVWTAWVATRLGDAEWFDRREVRAQLDALEVFEGEENGRAVTVTREALAPLLDGRATADELGRARETLEDVLWESGQGDFEPEPSDEEALGEESPGQESFADRPSGGE